MSPEPNHPRWNEDNWADQDKWADQDHWAEGERWSASRGWTEDRWDDEDWRDDAEQAPQSGNQRSNLGLVAWVVIGALLLGPLLTLRQLYHVEPAMILALGAVIGGVAYIAHARRGDALFTIEKLFRKRK